MKRLLYFLSILFLVTSCTREANKAAKITIKFPEKLLSSKSIPLSKNSKQKLNQQATNSVWGLESPVSVAAADCFGVYATVPDNANSSCVNTNGTQVISVNKLAGMAAAGSNLEIELTPGKSREIGVFAFKSADGTCKGLMDAGLNTSNFSAPLTVGKVTMDLIAGSVEVPINLSMTGSQSIEKCTGEPLMAWPAENSCAPSIAKMISTGGGELALEGACLSSANSLEILNSSTNEKYPLSIISKTSSALKAKLSASLTMNAGILYKLVVTTSNAQVVTPISLQIGSSLSVNSNGTKVGSFLTSAYSYYLGNGILLSTSTDQFGAYFAKNYDDPTGTNVVAGKYYLYSSIYLFNSIFQGLSAQDLLNANVLTGSSVPTSTLYFLGADCTGDMIISGSITDLPKGGIFIYPSSCTGSYPYVCTSFTSKKITTTGTYQNNVAYGSKIYTDGMNSSNSNVYCSNENYNISGFVIPSANITNTDANDPPMLIQNTTITR
jgi:hypothetical protein